MEDAYAAGEKAKDAEADAVYYSEDAISYSPNKQPHIGKAAVRDNSANNIAKDSTGNYNVYKVGRLKILLYVKHFISYHIDKDSQNRKDSKVKILSIRLIRNGIRIVFFNQILITMKTKLLSTVLLILISGFSFATTYTITGLQHWSDLSSTWSSVNTGDSVVIASGATLIINKNDCDDLQNKDVALIVYGTLDFDKGSSKKKYLYLSADSYIVLSGSGTITATSCSGKKRIYLGGTLEATCSGGSSNSTTTSSTYTTFADIISNGSFGSLPVPVTWLNYTATSINPTTVAVDWTTATEMNNSHFEVEYSADGANWEFVGEVASASNNGNSFELLNYNFIHNQDHASAVAFYRVKQIDFNGDFAYTEAMVVENKGFVPVIIQSHGDGSATIVPKSVIIAPMTVRIIDFTGAVVSEYVFNSNLDVTVDIAGVYYIEILDGSNKTVIKQFIQ